MTKNNVLKFFQALVLISTFLVTPQVLALETCSLIRDIHKQVECDNRNKYESILQLEQQEMQRQQLEMQRQQLELLQRQEMRQYDERKQQQEQRQQEQATQRQANSRLMDEEKAEFLMEVMAETVAMTVWGKQPDVARAVELKKTGQCKAARNLIQKAAQGGDSNVRKFSENLQGLYAQSCDKDLKLAKAHFLRAEQNGSKLAKLNLLGLDGEGQKSEALLAKPPSRASTDAKENLSKYNVEAGGYCSETSDCVRSLTCGNHECIGASIKAVSIKCKVIDEDIGTSYSGECKDGLAHGKGVAKGRDEYRGAFSEGLANGRGVYVWGAGSDWAGERYEGGFRNGMKHGFGTSSLDTNAKNKGLVSAYKEDGLLEKNRYVRRGSFENDVFVAPCNTADNCLAMLADAEQTFEKGNQFFQLKKYSEAYIFLKKAAEQGNARAQAMLGLFYLSGQFGIDKNVVEGLRWTYKAAYRGRASAQSALGSINRDSDPAESAKWYRKAADQGLSIAQYELGQMYEKGQGVGQDDKEAVSLYRKAADQGEAKAQFSLSKMYVKGKGVAQDGAEAIRWARKSADQGFAVAQWSMGRIFEDGIGVAKSETDAVLWYRKAADQGDVRAQLSLGLMYDVGKGVPKDVTEAIRWWRKAADQGLAEAQYVLGRIFENGDMGVTKSATEAVLWYRKAADQGYVSAQFSLGGIIFFGGNGVPKDEVEAGRWWRKAADQGLAEAQYRLGILYKAGRGVIRDEAEAISWFRKAADQGHAEAKIELGKLTSQ